MRLHEYQSKLLFAQFGIPVPSGKLATTPQEVIDIADELNCPTVLKPQALNMGDVQNTDIQFAQTPEIAQKYGVVLFKEGIKGHIVNSVLVEEAITSITEIYVAIVNNHENNYPMMIVAETNNGKNTYAKNEIDGYIYEPINPFIGFLEYQARDLAGSINLPFEYWKMFTKITRDLFRCYVANDASFIEINPLVITKKNELVALNGSIVIDDNALYRQPKITNMWDIQATSEPDIQAHKVGMSYKKLNGQIAYAVNGSGLMMTIMDMISFYGNESIQPAILLDMGEEAQATRIETALRIILNDRDSKAAIINIFGGTTSCDILALNILQILKDNQAQIPVIIRLTGERAIEGRAIISDTHLPNVRNVLSLTEAVQKVVTAASYS